MVENSRAAALRRASTGAWHQKLKPHRQMLLKSRKPPSSIPSMQPSLHQQEAVQSMEQHHIQTSLMAGQRLSRPCSMGMQRL